MAAGDGAKLVFFALAMIYLVLVVFASLRMRKLLQFSSEWRHAQIFYLLITTQATLRATLFLILCFDDSSRRDILVFSLISIPDSLFIVTYFMLFWQMLSVFYYAHFESQRRSHFLAGISKRPRESWVSLIFLALIVVWVLLQFALYLTMFISDGDSVSSDEIWEEVGSMNLLLPTVVLLSMLALQIVYSGRPLRDASWKRKLWKMIICTIVWSLGRYLDGIMSLCEFDITTSISSMISDDSSNGVLASVLLIIYLIVCEGICLFLVLDYGFMEIFMISETDHQVQPEENPRLKELDSIEETKDEAHDSFSSKLPLLATASEALASELAITEPLQGRKNGLGAIFKGRYRGHDVFCRKIELPRMNKYVLEELSEEVTALTHLQVTHMVPYYGVALDRVVITIVTPWFQRGSLHRLLHSSTEELPLRAKLKSALQIAKCLSALHAINRAHGHLSSHNVLMDESGNAYVADIGFLKLKKYIGLIVNYSCKSAWSSPESLIDKASTPVKPQVSDDTYSFGVLLWELLTGQEPFPGHTRAQLATQVAENDLRPEIPKQIPTTLAQLMKSCWNKDATTRPNFSLIVKTLESAQQSS